MPDMSSITSRLPLRGSNLGLRGDDEEAIRNDHAGRADDRLGVCRRYRRAAIENNINVKTQIQTISTQLIFKF